MEMTLHENDPMLMQLNLISLFAECNSIAFFINKYAIKHKQTWPEKGESNSFTCIHCQNERRIEKRKKNRLDAQLCH